MGILRKGLPYAPPENYESPADEARRKRLKFLERKERERQATEQRILEIEFAKWRRELSADELTRLVPDFARRPGPTQDSALKSHFEIQVWPQRTQQIEQSTGSENEKKVRSGYYRCAGDRVVVLVEDAGR